MADLNVKVGLDRSGFQTGLAAMENAVSGFGNKITGILAGSFSFAAIGAGISRAIDQGDQLQDLANRFGVAASSIQEIGNAASLSGASVNDVASAMNKLARNAGEAIGGNEQMAASFERIGLTTSMLQGMSPQDLFMALSKSVSSGALGMEDFAVAQELAGRGAATLMETLRMGPEAITANGRAMGVMSDETIAALSKASDAIKTFQTQMTNAFGQVAQFLVPAIEMYQMLAEQIGFVAAASKALFSGNFKDAMTIAASGKKARDDFFNRSAANKPQILRNTDAEFTKSTKENTDARVEQYNREAKAKEAAVERQKKAMQDEIDLSNKEEVTDARIENRAMIREAQRRRDATPGSKAFEEARATRLRTINEQRGNAPDFDPREALIRRMQTGAESGLTPAAMQDPVKNTTVQSISGQLSTAIARLEDIARKAGSFS